MKVLTILVFAVFPIAASAQTLDLSTIPTGSSAKHVEAVQSSIPAHVIQATQESGSETVEPARIKNNESEKEESIPAGAAGAPDDNQTVKSSTSAQGEAIADDSIEQTRVPTQIREERGAAMFDPAPMANTGLEKADRTPVAAVQPAEETQTGKQSDDEVTVDGANKQGSDERGAAAMPESAGSANTGYERGNTIPLVAVQPAGESRTVKSSTGNEDELITDGPEQSRIPAEIIDPTHEESGAAVLDPAPSARFEKADSIPVGTLQPIDENQAVKSSIKSEDELMVDGIKEQGTVPAEIIQPGHEQHSAVTRDPQAMANVGSEEEARIPIGAVQPAGGNQTLTPSTSSEGELTRDVGVEQGSIPAPIQGELGVAAPDSDEVANTGSEKKDRIPVGATVGGTNDQGTVPAEIIQRAHEERGAAILDGEGMATAGPEEGDRIPAGAVVPGDDDQLMKPFSSSYEP